MNVSRFGESVREFVMSLFLFERKKMTGEVFF